MLLVGNVSSIIMLTNNIDADDWNEVSVFDANATIYKLDERTRERKRKHVTGVWNFEFYHFIVDGTNGLRWKSQAIIWQTSKYFERSNGLLARWERKYFFVFIVFCYENRVKNYYNNYDENIQDYVFKWIPR